MSSEVIGGMLAAGEAAPDGSSAITWMLLLAALTLVPFLLTMVTSFAKLVIVGGILRQAIGAQVPPNSVLTGLALILSIHIMWPVGWDAYHDYTAERANAGSTVNSASLAALKPVRKFLREHATAGNAELFETMGAKMRSGKAPRAVAPEAKEWERTLSVDVPAFVLTELTQAFQIGFLLFIPFLVIDLIVANVLVSMGMNMLTPTTISLPLKLLLFVLVDGWRLLVQGLVSGYMPAG